MAKAILYLSHDAEHDWLSAIEFGQADDRLPDERRRVVSDTFCYVLRGPEREEIGFTVLGFSEFDPAGEEVSDIWEGPRFDVPALGLTDATAGEIVVGARAFLGSESTLNRRIFASASSVEGEDAVRL